MLVSYSSMYVTKYSTYIPLITALVECHTLAKTNRIDNERIFTKSDGYLVEIVQPTTTIDELEMMHGDKLHTCTKTGMACKQQEFQGQRVDVQCASNNQPTEKPI